MSDAPYELTLSCGDTISSRSPSAIGRYRMCIHCNCRKKVISITHPDGSQESGAYKVSDEVIRDHLTASQPITQADEPISALDSGRPVYRIGDRILTKSGHICIIIREVTPDAQAVYVAEVSPAPGACYNVHLSRIRDQDEVIRKSDVLDAARDWTSGYSAAYGYAAQQLEFIRASIESLLTGMIVSESSAEVKLLRRIHGMAQRGIDDSSDALKRYYSPTPTADEANPL